MSRKIRMTLSEKSIENALKALRNYETEFKNNVSEFEKRIGERVAELAQSGFDGAIADYYVKGSPKRADVSVSWSKNGNVITVIALGNDAVWVEFGAGVHFNGSAGSSPHPRGNELGMRIGTYGHGMGKKQVWSFKQGNKVVLTKGTPASMPMYNAAIAIANEIESIAKEIF